MPGAPFNPTTGERAPLAPPPDAGTRLALFQVIGDDPTDSATQDTHDNYVVCRGYEDPDFRYLHDPYTFPATTPINVAKPYSLRGTNPYVLGQVIVAARIKGRLGFNPGKAATTVGQPADLDEEVELLLDDDSKSISWMEVSAPPQVSVSTPTIAVLSENLAANPWASHSYISGPASPWSTTADGTVYGMQPLSGDFKFQVVESGATIINPLPFSFLSGAEVRVANHDGLWVVLGPANDIIRASVPGTSAGGSFITWGSVSADYGIFTASTDELTIGSAIGNMKFLAEWDVALGIVGTGGLAADIRTTAALQKNGATLTSSFNRRSTSDVTSLLNFAEHQHHGRGEVTLTAGDVLKLAISFTSGTPTIGASNVTLTPILGGL
jgi:hypothetical protein